MGGPLDLSPLYPKLKTALTFNCSGACFNFQPLQVNYASTQILDRLSNTGNFKNHVHWSLFNWKRTKNILFNWNLNLLKFSLDLRQVSRARWSSRVKSSGFPPAAPEGRHGIGQIREVGCWMRTSSAIYHTHDSTVLRNGGRKPRTAACEPHYYSNFRFYLKWSLPAVWIL